MVFVIVGIVVGVLLVGAVLGLVLAPSRRRGATIDAPPVAPSAPVETPPPVERSTPPPAPAPAVEAPPVEAPPAVVVPESPAAPEVERPEPSAGRLVRLRGRLAGSQSALGRGLLTLLSRDTIDEAVWEEVEDTLLTSDIGLTATNEIVSSLREQVRVMGARTGEHVRTMLRETLLGAVGRDTDRTLRTAPHDGHPAVVLVVGVNGTGKTTTCGKLARVVIGDGGTVLLGAADTFRAAAADQLSTWGERVGAAVVRGPEGADPASVAFDAVHAGVERRVDTVVIDTAGRLHTKTGLMDELGKVTRV
ncbi:MAG: signal recognition particle receptor subunit alpha, partial [Mycobacteriales bacterium]